MNWIDAHCHLANPRISVQLDQLITQAQSQGIKGFIQGGIGPEDWVRQSEIGIKFKGVFPCFGLHPYWVIEHNETDCELALDQLSKRLKDSVGIGEMGLDFRSHLVGDSRDRQISIFEKQIELSHFTQKPMVLHVVRAFDDAKKILELWQVPDAGGLVHAFAGGRKEADFYSKVGLTISIGCRLLHPNNDALRKALPAIPLEQLVFETDSPDQAPFDQIPNQNGEIINEPSNLLRVASAAGKLLNRSAEELLDISSQNLQKLFRITLL